MRQLFLVHFVNTNPQGDAALDKVLAAFAAIRPGFGADIDAWLVLAFGPNVPTDVRRDCEPYLQRVKRGIITFPTMTANSADDATLAAFERASEWMEGGCREEQIRFMAATALHPGQGVREAFDQAVPYDKVHEMYRARRDSGGFKSAQV